MTRTDTIKTATFHAADGVYTLKLSDDMVQVSGPGASFELYNWGEVAVAPGDRREIPAVLQSVARTYLATGCRTCLGVRYDAKCHA